MEDLIRHAGILLVDVLNNLASIAIVSGFFIWLFTRFVKKMNEKQDQQLSELRKDLKRVELMQSINHDFGLKVVGDIFDEYVALGGNHYAHEMYRNYVKEKNNE